MTLPRHLAARNTKVCGNYKPLINCTSHRAFSVKTFHPVSTDPYWSNIDFGVLIPILVWGFISKHLDFTKRFSTIVCLEHGTTFLVVSYFFYNQPNTVGPTGAIFNEDRQPKATGFISSTEMLCLNWKSYVKKPRKWTTENNDETGIPECLTESHLFLTGVTEILVD